MRFWEAVASGAAVISDHCLVHPPPVLVPGEHFLQYDNDLSGRGDQQDFVRFAALLEAAMRDDGATEALARRGYEAVRAHHTCEARARYVIGEVRATGCDLGGLT